LIYAKKEYLKHLHGTPQKWLLVFAGTGQSFDAPKGTETERAFLTSHAIIRFIHIISVDKVLPNSQRGSGEVRMGLTLEVSPPLSGVFRIRLRVLTNRVSDLVDILASPQKTGVMMGTYRRHEEHQWHNEH
jgi:hypothetical protein